MPARTPLAILTGLSLQAIIHTALRQTEGLLASILALLGLMLSVPKPPREKVGNAPIHLIVGSTGLTLHGLGEWTVEKHGTKARRSWRTLHLGRDADTGEIVVHLLTTKEVDDGSQVAPLLDQIDEPVAAFLAGGAYDTDAVTTVLTERHPWIEINVPPRVTAVLSEDAQSNPTQFDLEPKIRSVDSSKFWEIHSSPKQIKIKPPKSMSPFMF